MSTCICTACEREFSGLAAFDRHQSVDYSRRPAVTCLDPAALGLIRDPVSGRWGSTDGSAKREQGARLAASRPQGHAQTGEQPPAQVSG